MHPTPKEAGLPARQNTALRTDRQRGRRCGLWCDRRSAVWLTLVALLPPTLGGTFTCRSNDGPDDRVTVDTRVNP